MKNPFVIGLHWAFKSSDYLHMVLDFCPGGELFYHLTKYGKFEEDIARFYFAEVLLALEYLHDNNIVYRDLKPENVLLDVDGHVVLTDFGLSKDHFEKDNLAYSFCGSPEYMSPEMLSETGHGRMNDVYALGCLLYEFLNGLPPHYDADRDTMFEKIVTKPLAIPSSNSSEAKDLLKKLLTKNQRSRLGYKGGIAEIKKHPFLKSIDFEALSKKEIAPPFIPDIDESYFDTAYLHKHLAENPENYFHVKDSTPGVAQMVSRTGRVEQIYSGFSFYAPAEDTVLTELFSNRASGCNFDDFKQHTASTLSLGIDESKENDGFDTRIGIRERNLDEINKTKGKMIPEQEVKTFFHNKFDCAR